MGKDNERHFIEGKCGYDKIPSYRNPVLDFCCVLQYGSEWKYKSVSEIWEAMQRLKRKRVKDVESTVSVIITLDQTIFKREHYACVYRQVRDESIRKEASICNSM